MQATNCHEAVVDAYGSSERVMGWYYYLEGKMNVPFKAHCRLATPISILKVKEEVEVLGMAPEEECESNMFVWVKRTGGRIAVPLAQLQPLSKDQETREAVGDWLSWVDRGTSCERHKACHPPCVADARGWCVVCWHVGSRKSSTPHLTGCSANRDSSNSGWHGSI